jgi:hypothetical protein
MARRQPNYNFERKQREEKKAAKKQAKLEKARAKKESPENSDDLDTSADRRSDMDG